MRKTGFTLAETLITLAIIGVVAVVVISPLITNVQKATTINKLKVAYHDIKNAIAMAELEYGPFYLWDYIDGARRGSAHIFEYYIASKLNVKKSTNKPQSLTYYGPNNKKDTGYAFIRGQSVSYTSIKGYEMILVDNDIASYWGDAKSMSFFLDLNGHKKGPNRLGRDMFSLSIYPDEGFTFSHMDDGEYKKHGSVIRTREQLKNGPSNENYQCNKKGRGGWCGALIFIDDWQIKDDYPW